MKTYISRALVLIVLLFVSGQAMASHIVGGEMAYVFLGDSTSSGIIYNKYQVTLDLYVDCINGQPEAIAEDNPAFFGVFDAVTQNTYEIDTNIYYSSSSSVPDIYSSPCGTELIPSSLCLLKRAFIKTYALPANPHGYVVAYERCCRNAGTGNITDPADNGVTYYCTIPPSGTVNNSAVFKNYPPQTICLNQPLDYDNSATDADGDSLSYGFCAALLGGNEGMIKPMPYFPAWGDSAAYIVPAYSSQIPLTGAPSMAINAVTGLMTGAPNQIGRYVVAVYCNEWRGGALINTVKQEFEFTVNECSFSSTGTSAYAGADTIVIAGDSVHFNAIGGTSYSWAPATYLNDTSISNPVGYFPVPGVFTYTLHETSDTGCNGTATRTITVLGHSDFIVPTGFTPNGDGKNDYLMPIPILGSTLTTFKVYNRNGNLVYSGGASDQGWDGNYKGVKQDLGTYYWEIKYLDNNGAERKQKGESTLVQ